MSWPEQIDSAPLAATYLVANTPAYLYKAFRGDDSVRRLAQLFTAEELAKLFRKAVAQTERSPIDVVQAYAALVAMTLHDYEEWRSVLMGLDVTVLDWGERIRQIALSRAVSSLVTSYDMPTQVPAGVSAGQVATTETKLIVAQQPKVTLISD